MFQYLCVLGALGGHFRIGVRFRFIIGLPLPCFRFPFSVLFVSLWSIPLQGDKPQRHEAHKDEERRARSRASRGARESAREEKDLDVGAPLWVPRPILIVEKKVFGLGLEARGATTPRDNTGV